MYKGTLVTVDINSVDRETRTTLEAIGITPDSPIGILADVNVEVRFAIEGVTGGPVAVDYTCVHPINESCTQQQVDAIERIRCNVSNLTPNKINRNVAYAFYEVSNFMKRNRLDSRIVNLLEEADNDITKFARLMYSEFNFNSLNNK